MQRYLLAALVALASCSAPAAVGFDVLVEHERIVAGHIAWRRAREMQVLVGGVDIQALAVGRDRDDHVIELVDAGHARDHALVDIHEGK